MPINFDTLEIEDDLERFKFSVKAIDIESVKERTLRRAAIEMSKVVRQLVFESSIRSPADKISPFEGGEGPPLATQKAWIVEKDGTNYAVRPHPKVRQRAIVLNFGYPGEITPNDKEYLRFTIDGVPYYRKSVEGPDPVGYWQAAFNRMEKSGKLKEIAQEELNDEFEEKM